MAAQSTDLRHIRGRLALWDARLRVTQSLIWLPRGVVGGLTVALIVALVARFRPLVTRTTLLELGILLPLAGGAVALVAVWVWKRSPLALARRFDRLFGLRERLSTALELSQGVLPVESKVVARRQLEQAAQTASHVRASQHLPLRLDWRWWAGIAIAVFALVLAVVIPNPQDLVLAQQAEVKASLTQALTKLDQIKTQVTEDPSLTVDEKQAAIKSLDKAIETLKQPDISQQEALAALNSAEQELRELNQQSTAEQQKALEGLSGLFSETAAKDLAEALASGDMEAAGEALKNLDPGNLTPEQQQQLAEALQSASDALEGSNPELSEQLGEAASALQSGDASAAGEALDQAGETIGEAGQASSGQGDGSQEGLEGYADQVGESGEGVARAGKSQGSQPGQGGMGQAQTNGGPGSSNQPGQGQSSGGAGRGEGDGNPDGGGTINGPMETDNGPGDAGETPWDEIFAPQRVGGEGGEQVDVPGKPDAGVPTGVEGNFANNPEGQTNVPYNQVWSDYAGAVNQALDSGYIPLGMRDLIKNYFSNLDPGKK